ncbi:MAG: alpha/beta fold hydrolase [Hyphomicrobiaceae bacterium]
MKVVAEHMGGPSPWERRHEERKAISRANARITPGQRNEQRRLYSRATIATIRTPTLFLSGADTHSNFMANVEVLSIAIAGSKVVVIRNATHGLPYENPTDFNAAVIDYPKSTLNSRVPRGPQDSRLGPAWPREAITSTKHMREPLSGAGALVRPSDHRLRVAQRREQLLRA